MQIPFPICPTPKIWNISLQKTHLAMLHTLLSAVFMAFALRAIGNALWAGEPKMGGGEEGQSGGVRNVHIFI